MDKNDRTYRVLAIDDDAGMLTTYRDILTVEGEDPHTLEALFEEGGRPKSGGGVQPVSFNITLCATAREGVGQVEKALAAQDPFAVALIDVRLLTGMDGVEAAETIRKLDSQVEIVMVSGYTDVTSRELNRRIPPPDKLLYLQKPFRAQELRQLALSLCEKWSVERELKDLNETLAQKVENRTRELHKANRQLRRDIKDLQEMEEKLRMAQKMEALGTMAGGIAHDFNNMLGVIMGYAELIQEKAAADEGLARRAGAIMEAGGRAGDLITQILNFSRQAPQERKPLHFTPLLKEAMKLIRASIPASIEIHTEIRAEPDLITADPTQLHQILMNLCTNAHHAMRETGGELFVTLDPADDGCPVKPPRELGAPRHFLRLTVRDTGTGIDPQVLDRVFDPFFTTKKPGEGTGMGLAVVHGIVKGHEGAVRVASEPGKGSTFSVFLPRSSEMEPHAEAPAPGRIPEGLRVLFVDDEKPLVDVGKDMLEGLGCEVTGRTSSVEALEAFRFRPEAFDLVVTDNDMPNMTGVELGVELLAIREDIPVILCTGFSESLTVDRLRSLGLKGFIRKPIVKDQLARTIAKVMAEG